MTCIPQSGGCERRATDALVSHLNHIEKARYEFIDCLDRTHRQTPQPETLYVDHRTGSPLVIERKSISWPADYPRLHNNDHLLADVISDELRDIPFEDVYVLRLPALIEGRREELLAFGKAVSQKIRLAYPIKPGHAIGSKKPGRHWAFYLQRPEDREDDHPKAGIIFNWEQRLFSNPYIDPSQLPPALETAVKQIYEACIKKFAQYSSARRILVLDPHGELRYHSANWWNDLFNVYSPPIEAEEIWSGVLDWVDDWEQGWICESLWGKHFQRRPELNIEIEDH
jgi:hypothetical protein